ncbi:hypothetical protein ACROYT_G021005 [Oculina patagonica]
MNQAKFFAVLFAMCLVMALVNINGNAKRIKRRRDHRLTERGRTPHQYEHLVETGKSPKKEKGGHDGFVRKDLNF